MSTCWQKTVPGYQLALWSLQLLLQFSSALHLYVNLIKTVSYRTLFPGTMLKVCSRNLAVNSIFNSVQKRTSSSLIKCSVLASSHISNHWTDTIFKLPFIYIYIYIYIYVYIYVYIYIYIYIYIYSHIYISIYICVCACVHACVMPMCVCIYRLWVWKLKINYRLIFKII